MGQVGKIIIPNGIRKSSLLILLCWLVYTCSYLGRLGYNANIALIESDYNVSHSTAGIVGTFFFFAYGCGQVINGLLCKRYPLRLIVFCGLIISSAMNILMVLTENFSLVKYLWLINGGALSILWTSLIRLLSETLTKEDMARAVIIMSTPAPTGTFLIYGLSTLFVAFSSYRVTFILTGILLLFIAIVWFFMFPKLVEKQSAEEKQIIREENNRQKNKQDRALLWAICILAFFAIINNLVKDGLTTWLPIIFKEIYGLPDSIGILLTMLLPILSFFGTALIFGLNKKIKDFVILVAFLFFVSAIFIAVVILCLPIKVFFITLISFCIVSCVMAGANNIFTSMAPLYWKDSINAGTMAGVLNGFCYLGSTISSYGLGAVADFGGWSMVLVLLLSLCILATITAVIYSLVHQKEAHTRDI